MRGRTTERIRKERAKNERGKRGGGMRRKILRIIQEED